MNLFYANIEINFNNAHSMRFKYYFNFKYPFTMNTKISKHNMKRLMQEDVRLYILFNYMSLNIKAGNNKTALEVVTVEVLKAEMYELFDKNHIKSLLDKLEHFGYIKRVNQSQRNNHYYINPHVIHSMNSNQCSEFIRDHKDLFIDVPDMIEELTIYGVPPMMSVPSPMPIPMPVPAPSQMPVPHSASAED